MARSSHTLSLVQTTASSKTKISFLVIGLVSFFIRAFVNFSQGLLIGNGGYYPLQVRTVLERNELAFSDMPLLFYLEAGIVHILSFFGAEVINDLILNVVKVVDSVSIPLLLIPLYYILKQIKTSKFSNLIMLIVAFSVMSFHTLSLVSTSQKNSLAITFLFCSIAFFLAYLKNGEKKQLIFSLAFFALIGFTHFGTFSFALLMASLYLIFKYRWKAIVPLIGICITGVALVYVFDPTRSARLLSVWEELFSMIPNPAQLLLMLVYIATGVIAWKAYRKHKVNFKASERVVIQTLIALLIIVPLPIINPQYTDRMIAFLFIPFVLLLLYFSAYLSKRIRIVLSVLIGFIIVGSITMTLGKGAPSELSKEALADLKNMKSLISHPKETVVVSKHNLEFWVAWELSVSVSQEAKFDDELISDYDEVLIINHLQSRKMGPKREGEEKRPSHFDEPKVPSNSELIYSSEYFKLYRYLGD